MRPFFDPERLFTLRLTDMDAQCWSFDRAVHAELHADFLASQLLPSSYEFCGRRFFCPSGVFHVGEESSTRLILRGLLRLVRSIEDKVLDVGTGSGALGVFLASAGKRVTATDIDDLAIESAKANAEENGVTMKVIRSDMFDAVDDRDFNFIVFNAPFGDMPSERPIDKIACDPGGVLLRRLLQEAPRYLSPAGVVVFLTSSIGSRQVALDCLAAYDHYVLAADYRADSGVWRWLVCARPAR